MFSSGHRHTCRRGTFVLDLGLVYCSVLAKRQADRKPCALAVLLRIHLNKQWRRPGSSGGVLEMGMYTGVLVESGLTLNGQEWTRGRGVVYINYMLGETEYGIFRK